jgi:hypothetical protein
MTVPEIGKRIVEDIARVSEQVPEIQRLKNEASFRALRAGCALIVIKQTLDHGKFIPYCEATFEETSHQHLNKYMRLAEAFCRQKKIAPESAYDQMAEIDAATVIAIDAGKTDRKALPAGSPAAQAVLEGGMAQMVFDFIGGSSLRDLFAACGIMKPASAPKEPPPPCAPLTHADKVRTYTDAWRERCVELNEHGMRQKTWLILEPVFLTQIVRLLEDLARAMKEDIDRQTKKPAKKTGRK